MAEGSISDLEQTKREIRSILVSCSGNSLTMRQLCNDYKSMMGCDIPFASLGFPSLTSFLNTLRDTVYLERVPFPRSPVVHLVVSDQSAHIQKLVNDQRNNRKRFSNRSNGPPLQMRSNNFHCGRGDGIFPFPIRPQIPLPILNTLQNYLPHPYVGVNYYPPQPQRRPFNRHQPPPVCLTQVQIETLITFDRIFRSVQQMRTIAQHNLLLQQQIQLAQTLEALKLKYVVDPKTTSNRPLHQPKGAVSKPLLQCNSIDPSVTAAIETENESDHCKPQEVPQATETSLTDSSNSDERNYSGLTNLSRGDSYISAALSENKNSVVSWSNDIVDYIDHINISDIEPMNNNTYTAVALNIRYPAAKLPSKFEKNIIGEIELIAVCELNSPSKFWIHLTSQYDVLTEILERLEEVYSKSSPTELCLKEIDMQKGQLCAVLFKNVWHRGEILSDPNRAKCVKVSLVDYGPIITTASSNVRALTNELAAYPIQAFDAYLTNVEPIRNSWDKDCTNKLAEMVSEAFLYARIIESKPGPVLGIELIDTRNDDDVIINQKLIDIGFAKRK